MSFYVRAATWVGGALLSTVALAIILLQRIDWTLGLATMPDNAQATQTLGEQTLRFLLALEPNTAIMICIGGLFFFGLWIMSWAVRKTETIRSGAAPQVAKLEVVVANKEQSTPASDAGGDSRPRLEDQPCLDQRAKELKALFMANKEIVNADIHLPLLSLSGIDMIHGKKFIKCKFIGPMSVTLLNGLNIQTMHHLAPPEHAARTNADSFVVEIIKPTTIYGVMAFSDCIFIECSTMKVLFVLPTPYAVAMRDAFDSK